MQHQEIMNTSTEAPMPEGTSPYVRPFNDDAITVSATFILAMLIFGIFANLVTIIVITKSRRLRSIFNILIASLCVSDLLSALVSPLFLYRRTWGFDEWLIPKFLCKVFWSVDTWTSYATAVHILLFAVIRMISIKWSFTYKKIKVAHVKVIAAVIWFVTFCCGFIPRWVWYEARTRDRHASTVDAKWPACTLNTDWLIEYRLYYKIAFPIFIYLPMAMVAVLCPAIAVILMQQRKKRFEKGKTLSPQSTLSLHSKSEQRKRREKYAIMQLAFITGSFMFGYIPITYGVVLCHSIRLCHLPNIDDNAYTFYTTNVKSTTMAGKIFDWNFGMLAYLCLRLSECLNPVFYNVASGKMRRETFALLKGLEKQCLRPINGRRTSTTGSSGTNETASARNTNDLEL